ncbi:uncharacterized protein LOC127796372 [Diospyros lotus]|uniref:uncharacterized protein LOC127796372 n=1 Tax=Diospyros lotus TaxID=55363 RepID=UPI0022513656|nr:uncharacterized protein LOC127796372 [Diospyros lotus]
MAPVTRATIHNSRSGNTSQESVGRGPECSEEVQSHFMGRGLVGGRQVDTNAAKWLKAFMDLRPPTFKGQLEADLSIAKYWVEDIFQLLEYMDCPRDQWIQKKRDFMELKQQSHLTVSQYEDEFVKLLKYIPTYMLSEVDKMERFIQWLRPEVRRGMSYVEAHTFHEAVAKAVNIEKRVMNYGEITRAKEPFSEGLKKVVPNQGHQFTRPEAGKFKKELKACPKCYKPHRWSLPCRIPRATKECYNCGEMGHIVRNCPKWLEMNTVKTDPPVAGVQRKPIVCFNCNTPGHIASWCPQREKTGLPRSTEEGA